MPPKPVELLVQVEKMRRQLDAALKQPRLPKPAKQKMQKLARDFERMHREMATAKATKNRGRFRLLVQALKELIVRCVELIWRSDNGP